MSIAPIRRQVTVKPPPDVAFRLFTGSIGQWWPARTSIGAQPPVAVVLEPFVDGRWYERDADGRETQWGKVLAWEPPGRVLLAWQINAAWTFDPALITEVEVTFVPAADGGTLVTLEHRNLERLGADAERVAGQLGGGWPTLLDLYATLASAQTEGDSHG